MRIYLLVHISAGPHGGSTTIFSNESESLCPVQCQVHDWHAIVSTLTNSCYFMLNQSGVQSLNSFTKTVERERCQSYQKLRIPTLKNRVRHKCTETEVVWKEPEPSLMFYDLQELVTSPSECLSSSGQAVQGEALKLWPNLSLRQRTGPMLRAVRPRGPLRSSCFIRHQGERGPELPPITETAGHFLQHTLTQQRKMINRHTTLTCLFDLHFIHPLQGSPSSLPEPLSFQKPTKQHQQTSKRKLTYCRS